MSTRLKSSRPEISLTRYSTKDAVIKVYINMNETFKLDNLTRLENDVKLFDAVSLTRAQAQALGQDLLAFANEMEVAEYE